MKRMIYYAAAMAVLALGACSKDDSGSTTPTTPTPTPTPEPGKTQIAFTTQIETTEGTTEEGFTAGDTFSLVAYDNAEGCTSMDYTLGATALYWEDLTFATEGGSVHFSACYPKHTLTEGGFDFTVTQDPSSDLLWATHASVGVGTQEAVDLTFRHALHRLKVDIAVEDPTVDASQIEVSCTALSTCRVDLKEMRLMQGETQNTYTAMGQSVEFMLLPQLTDIVTLEVKAGELTQSWKLSETDFPTPELEGGKQATVHLTIKDGRITLSGMTIAGWGDQGTVEDEIEM